MGFPPKPPNGKPPAQPAQPAPAPEPEAQPDHKRYIILGAVIVVILVVVGVAALVLWPKPEQLGERAEIVQVEDVESPRAILDGISKLQEGRRAGTGSYADHLAALVEEAKTGPTEVSPKTLAAIADLLAASNLAGRLIGRGGYEVAMKKDEKTWLVLSWSQNSGKQIKPVPSTSGPPFAVTSPRPVARVVEPPPPAAVAETEAPTNLPAAAEADSAPAPAAPETTATTPQKPAAPTSAPAPASAAKAPRNGPSTSHAPTIVIEETKDDGDWVGAKLLLKTSGTMRSGGQYVAIVNGNMVRKGDVVAVTLGGRQYQFTVTAIDTRNVEYEPLNR